MDNKEKLKEAKRLYETANADQKYVLESLFPELKEPEDERIRKALIGELKIENSNYKLFKDIPKERFIAWLEKQGELKPYGQRKECVDCQFNYAGECKGYCAMKRSEQKSAWSEEDEGLLYWTVNNLEEIKSKYGGGYGKVSKCRNWVLSFKDRVQPQPKQEWNSGDDAHFHSLITHLEDFIASHPNTTGADIQGENIAWLESLKDRYTWKPSDEQMKALYNSIPEDVKEISEREMLLNELYKDLKKLR